MIFFSFQILVMLTKVLHVCTEICFGLTLVSFAVSTLYYSIKIGISTIDHYRLLSVENLLSLSLSLSVKKSVSVIPAVQLNIDVVAPHCSSLPTSPLPPLTKLPEHVRQPVIKISLDKPGRFYFTL